jgi:RNA recognition motif-containing protein
MSIRLYVGNLPKEIDRKELQAVFADAGDSVTTKIITDRKTGKCRGFGFVTVKNDEEADQIIEKYNGYLLKENALKIEKALPRSKGKSETEEAPARPTSAGGSGGGGGSSRRSNKKSRGSSSGSSSTQTSESNQPDPRWAQELEKLKQMLATQASNS